MRSRWVVVMCVLVAAGGTLYCKKAEPGPGPDLGGPDHRVVLDLAKLDANAKQCGQKVDDVLTIWSDDVPGDDLARRVSFELKNAGDSDRVEINKKPDSDNDANWGNMKLGKGHAVEATPRVPKGQVKKEQSLWKYAIVFNGGSCTIDPGICIRTQGGGCTN